MKNLFRSESGHLSIILDLVEAVQALQHALRSARPGINLPSEDRMAIDVALATSEMATKSILNEIKKILELDNQPKNQP